MRNKLLFGGLALALAVPNVAIMRKEALLSTGIPMLVELAPVDPRSLIQGDYMRLNYAIASDILHTDSDCDGIIVVTMDENGVARFARCHPERSPLSPIEHVLKYRQRDRRIRIASDAFYFQEGQAARYRGAKYGELRVDRWGNSVLVGLRDEQLRPLSSVP